MSAIVTNGISCKSNSTNGNIAEDSFLQCDDLKKGTNEVESLKKKKLSYFKGDTTIPLRKSTLGQLLQETAIQWPEKTAISFFGGKKFTYGEVLEKVDTLAARFLHLGLKRGDHIALWGFNTIEWYISFLAATRAGLVAVLLNPLYEAAELQVCLNIGDVKAIIMDEKLNNRNFYDILKKAVPEIEKYDYNSHITSQSIPFLNTVIIFTEKSYKGTFKWNELFIGITAEEKQKIGDSMSDISCFDVCAILFTSGTTSTPKGVLLTHYNIVNNGYFPAKYLKLLEKSHRVCVQVPFFHSYGLVAGIISNIHAGTEIVLPSEKFSPNKSIDCINKEKCTVVYGTPTMYIDLMTVIQKRAATNPQIFDECVVERFFTGGATCLPNVIVQLKKLFKNVQVTSGYGMTETSPCTIISLPDDSDDILMSTVGRVLDHTEVKVVDNDNQMVPFGSPGEICFKGYMIMKGYYKEPKKTEAVLTKDGWLHSGDRSILFENGYVQMVGRIKDIIIRGGENIEPKEVEETLIKHPDIIDVQIYAITDARLGETVAAAILKTENSTLTTENVKEYCKSTIASYKIPEHIIFVEEFPKTSSGKVQKYKLREMTEKILNIKH